jgi:CDP-paratose 2-epimerase
MILVTGAGGLIGGESVEHFSKLGEHVIGIDNNSRGAFFGVEGDVSWNLNRLSNKYPSFENFEIDIRDFDSVRQLIKQTQPAIIIHAAAQPSHDRASTFPLTDFEVNALGTLNLLEATRLESAESVFIHLSTNKVYGDGPNRLELKETKTRYEFASLEFRDGIDENFSMDQSLHSLFGASKLSADIYAQEYGKYYGLKVGVFRGGCLTGPNHSGVQLHGFLSYLISCHILQKPYTVFGYKGKQVRDQIHCEDVLSAFELFAENPKYGEVYNLGGGKSNSGSIIEISEHISKITQRPLNFGYQETPRRGDHICYYSNMSKFKSHYTSFNIKKSLDLIIEEMMEVSLDRAKEGKATFLL